MSTYSSEEDAATSKLVMDFQKWTDVSMKNGKWYCEPCGKQHTSEECQELTPPDEPDTIYFMTLTVSSLNRWAYIGPCDNIIQEDLMPFIVTMIERWGPTSMQKFWDTIPSWVHGGRTSLELPLETDEVSTGTSNPREIRTLHFRLIKHRNLEVRAVLPDGPTWTLTSTKISFDAAQESYLNKNIKQVKDTAEGTKVEGVYASADAAEAAAWRLIDLVGDPLFEPSKRSGENGGRAFLVHGKQGLYVLKVRYHIGEPLPQEIEGL